MLGKFISFHFLRLVQVLFLRRISMAIILTSVTDFLHVRDETFFFATKLDSRGAIVQLIF